MKTLTIISPVFNEEEVIENFYRKLKETLDFLQPKYKSKILFVVDQCTDNTVKILEKISKNDSSVTVLLMSARFGHQMSLLAGIDYADSDIYIMMDSDLQHPPSLIPEMVNQYEQGYEVVYTLRSANENESFARSLCGKIFYKIMNKLSDAQIYENAADFRLITQKVAEVFRHKLRERNMFLRGLVSWVGFKQTSLSYVAAPRLAGQSKYSLLQMLNLAKDAIVSFSTFPLKLSLIAGSLFSFFGFIYAIITFIQYFVFSIPPGGWTTLVILITMFSGAQLLCLGMVGTYIGAIYLEVKNRPHYIVDEIISQEHLNGNS